MLRPVWKCGISRIVCGCGVEITRTEEIGDTEEKWNSLCFVLKIGAMGSIVLVVFVYLLHLLNPKMVG